MAKEAKEVKEKEINLKVRPLDDRVVVEPLEAEEKTAGGILLPDSAKQKPQRGRILAVGPGKLRDNGERAALAVAKGDEVLYGRYGGNDIQVENKELKILRESDILAKVVKESATIPAGRPSTHLPEAAGKSQGTQDRAVLRALVEPHGDPSHMAKQLLYTDDARKKMLVGAEKLAHAVGVTLGPTGRNVILDKSFGGPTVTKDGVTVSKEVELADPFENMGAKLVNAVAQKTSDVAGDGTTTATILALSIYQEGLRNITAGANPMAVKRGIDKGVDAAVKYLEGITKKLSKKEEMEQVATISANNDPVIGKLMADAFEKVGKDGVITVEEGKTSDTALEFVEGMQFDKGYISPYFMNNSQDMTCDLEDALILIHEKKLANVRDMLPLLEKVAQSGKPFLIIAEDVESEALAMLVVNKLRGILNVCAVKAPGFGDRRKAMLGDIATLTGGQFISEDLGIKLENVTLEQLGKAKTIKVEKESTTLVSGGGKKQDIQRRIEQIRTQMDQTESEYDKEKFSERLAKLTGGVAIVRVGAATEAEMKQTKGRIEDALHATRAAVAEGILPGGGVALVRSIAAVQALARGLEGDERLGVEIVVRALEKPIRTIAENSGTDGAVVADEVRQQKSPNFGYNANTGEYVDMYKAGIVDPFKVTRSALQFASSIAGLMLTTEVMVTKIDEEEPRNKVAGAIR